MSNIVNINNIKKSNYIPVTDKDFDNLYVYKINTLLRVLKKESKDLRIYKLRELFFGNYLLQFNNELIKQEEIKKITKVLKTVDENYNNEYEDY